MKYVVENGSILYGPFDTPQAAAEWALRRCATPWILRSIHFIPQVDEENDDM